MEDLTELERLCGYTHRQVEFGSNSIKDTVQHMADMSRKHGGKVRDANDEQFNSLEDMCRAYGISVEYYIACLCIGMSKVDILGRRVN